MARNEWIGDVYADDVVLAESEEDFNKNKL